MKQIILALTKSLIPVLNAFCIMFVAICICEWRLTYEWPFVLADSNWKEIHRAQQHRLRTIPARRRSRSPAVAGLLVSAEMVIISSPGAPLALRRVLIIRTGSQ